MRSVRPAGSLVSVFLCATLPAQLDWMSGAAGPPGRNVAALVIDHVGGGLLLFGGYANGQYFNDTWRWVGGSWLRQTPVQSPPPRYGAELASDPVRGRIVLFGGSMPITLSPLGDTWEWDGVNWLPMQPATSPAARSQHGMTYDPSSGRTLMFGGDNTFSSFNDTWLWDGVQWTQASPATTPPLLNRPRLAFDASRGLVVMTDGLSRLGLGSTWQWDGTNWSVAITNGTQPGANGGAMTYDAARERIVWYGGCDNNGNELPIGVLDYDGNRWTSRPTTVNPPLRYWHAMAFDPLSQRIVSFAGRVRQAYLSDNWLLHAVYPATAVSFGAGCAGSGGVVQLDAQNRPWLGDALRLRWSNLPATGALVALAFGTSNQNWNGLSLPQPLGSFGLTGCSLLVSLEALATVTAANSVLDVSLPVPSTASLLGRNVFLQGFVFDAAANAAGLAASNGVTAHLGSR